MLECSHNFFCSYANTIIEHRVYLPLEKNDLGHLLDKLKLVSK